MQVTFVFGIVAREIDKPINIVL